MSKNRKMRRRTKKPNPIQWEAKAVIEAAEGDALPRVSMKAYSGGVMKLPAYPLPVVVDCSGVSDSTVPLLRQHDPERIVGHGQAESGSNEINVEGEISGQGGHVDELLTLSKRGFQWQASIGLQPTKIEKVDAGSEVTVNGQQFAGPLVVARSGYLREVSIVTIGADKETSVNIAAEADLDGFDIEAFKVELRDEILEEVKGSESLAKVRNRGDLPDSSQRADASEHRLIECALDRSITGFDESEWEPKVLQASEDRYGYGGLSLMELVCKAARANGYRSDSHRISQAMFDHAFGNPMIVARGASTYDLSGILSNVANKQIRSGFDHVDSSWRSVAATAPVNDLKQVTRYALTGDFKFEKVGKGGEIKSATAGEETYTNKADTYAKLFAITREDFINDDLGAFNMVRRKIGRGGALKFNDVFWTEFLADIATFWTTARGNYFEGAATNLQSSSLETAQKMMREQTDPDGELLGMMGDRILVPPSLEVTADELHTSTNLNSGGAASTEKIPNRNHFAGKYRPVISAYIGTASGITNSSDTHWFILTDPMNEASIEAVFLNGVQRPIVEAAQADFDQLGVSVRGIFDFGMNKQEYRAGVRSKGAA